MRTKSRFVAALSLKLALLLAAELILASTRLHAAISSSIEEPANQCKSLLGSSRTEATVLLVNALGEPVLAVPSASEKFGASPASQAQLKTATEVLTGARAGQVLDELKQKHPERFARAGSALAQHGYHPTGKVTIARTMTWAVDATWQSRRVPGIVQATTATTSQGQVILQAWDDGYDGTWEGTIYVEDYSDGHWATWDVQFNIESADYFETWSEPLSSGAPGGPGGGGPIEARGWTQSSRGVLVAALGVPDLPGIIVPTWHAGGGPHYVSTDPFLQCVTKGAGACAAGCAFTGPGWGGCFVPCAVAAIT